MWGILLPKKILEKVVKVKIKENDQQIKCNYLVIENVNFKYPDTKIYIEENLNEKTWMEKKKIK